MKNKAVKKDRLIIFVIALSFVLLIIYSIFIINSRNSARTAKTLEHSDNMPLSDINPLLETLKRQAQESQQSTDESDLAALEKALLESDYFSITDSDVKNSDINAINDEDFLSRNNGMGTVKESEYTHDFIQSSNDNPDLDPLYSTYGSKSYSDGTYQSADTQTYAKESSQAISGRSDGDTLSDMRQSAFNSAVKSSSRLNIGAHSFKGSSAFNQHGSLSEGMLLNSNHNMSYSDTLSDRSYEYEKKYNRKNSKPVSDITLESYKALKHDDYTLEHKVQGVSTPYLIRQGSVIPAILLTGINSQLPGQVQAQITRDIYDTPQGRYILIPRGSKLIGQYGSSPAIGQERVMMGFNRIIFPDGRALNIGSMPGSGNDGMAGFDADVNTHFFRLLTYSALLGTISASVDLAGSHSDDDKSGIMHDTLTASLGQAISESIRQHMSLSPTLEVESGYAFNLTLTQDIYFDKNYKDYKY